MLFSATSAALCRVPGMGVVNGWEHTDYQGQMTQEEELKLFSVVGWLERLKKKIGFRNILGRRRGFCAKNCSAPLSPAGEHLPMH